MTYGSNFMADFVLPPRHELETIRRRTVQQRSQMRLAVSAHYDPAIERVMITLNTGAIVGFPLSALPGLENATAEDLDTIEIQQRGYGIHVEKLDADIAIPPLMADYLGSNLMSRAIKRAVA